MSAVISRRSPALFIVMGVSGCGKSTVSESLAEHFGITSLDADDFHSAENKAHMASGQPLTDAMRVPWVHGLRDHLALMAAQGESCTLAFSGLRKAHRDVLRNTGHRVFYLLLDGSRELIAKRMQARAGHFMPASLLDSQFAALERPMADEQMMYIDIDQPVDGVMNTIYTLVDDLI